MDEPNSGQRHNLAWTDPGANPTWTLTSPFLTAKLGLTSAAPEWSWARRHSSACRTRAASTAPASVRAASSSTACCRSSFQRAMCLSWALPALPRATGTSADRFLDALFGGFWAAGTAEPCKASPALWLAPGPPVARQVNRIACVCGCTDL